MVSKKTTTLEGVTVADFSHALAAPYGSMILADMGADVIKIESPAGDMSRPALGGAWNIMANRNKRAISVDLKQEQGKEIVRKVLEKADVLIESFTPGVIGKLGFGYETVRAINPKIIYCSISGFGQTGPYKDMRGFDVVAQAFSGLMLNTGEPDCPPVRVGTSAVDMGSGMYLALGILLALMDREKTGEGQRIDISLFETALSWMSPYTVGFSKTGTLPQRLGSGYAAFCPYKVFDASDGYVFVGVATDQFWKYFCEALDFMDLYENPKYLKTKGRLGNRKELDDLVQKGMKRFKVAEVVEKLRKAGVPVAPLLSVAQTLEDPQAKARDIFVSMDHPEYGPVKFTRTPIVRSGKMPEVCSSSPFLGEHTREVMAEVGYSKEQIDELISSGIAIDVKK